MIASVTDSQLRYQVVGLTVAHGTVAQWHTSVGGLPSFSGVGALNDAALVPRDAKMPPYLGRLYP